MNTNNMSTNKQFIHETEVYRILSQAGLAVPVHGTVRKPQDVQTLPFKDGESVVVKGIARDLWHKSDESALFFTEFSKVKIGTLHEQIQKNLAGKYSYIETLVCRRVPFRQAKERVPAEAFVSFKRDFACGMTLFLGMGGILSESWASELKCGVMKFPIGLTRPDQAYEEFRNHYLGKIWLGKLRQSEPLITEEKARQFLESLWKTAEMCAGLGIELLEMNPVVLDENGTPIALDGVGVKAEIPSLIPAPPLPGRAILHPKKFAIAGVSSKEGSFGKRIFENLLESKVSRENLLVIKPGETELQGIRCIPDLKALKEDPADALILALPAPVTVEMIETLCLQGGGAEVVYVVAGGMGDGADQEGHAKKISDLLSDRRARGLWTPRLVGPNNLGVVLSELSLSTLFIDSLRLPIHYAPAGNLAFISQSGAFFITRISNETHLPIKYGFCIGNQLDLKASDFLELFSSDPSIQVIATYIEGFGENEALEFARKASALQEQGKRVIVYKGGRSEAGMKAAAGHTGAMAGNYDLQKNLLLRSGVMIAESYREFSSLINLLSHTPNLRKPLKVSVITNAGFESVASADFLDHARLLKLSARDEAGLRKLLTQENLISLVSPHNPLDLTPMAGASAYLGATEIFLNLDTDLIVVGIIPLTERLEISDPDKIRNFAQSFRQISETTGKPVVIVIDSGEIYNDYCRIFKEQGLSVFRSIEEPFEAIRLL